MTAWNDRMTSWKDYLHREIPTKATRAYNPSFWYIIVTSTKVIDREWGAENQSPEQNTKLDSETVSPALKISLFYIICLFVFISTTYAKRKRHSCLF